MKLRMFIKVAPFSAPNTDIISEGGEIEIELEYTLREMKWLKKSLPQTIKEAVEIIEG